jgi:hypothetical protein
MMPRCTSHLMGELRFLFLRQALVTDVNMHPWRRFFVQEQSIRNASTPQYYTTHA